MTKVAHLHDGTQIHFPDHAQDHEMDAAVARHMGANAIAAQPMPVTAAPAAPAAAPANDMMPMMMQLMANHMKVLAAKNGVDSGDGLIKEKRAAAQLHHKTMVVSAAAHNDTMKEVGGQLAEHIAGMGAHVHEGIAALAEPLAHLAQNSERVGDLIKSINNLSATVLEATKAIVGAMHAPKEIYTGPDGKPKGVKTKGK